MQKRNLTKLVAYIAYYTCLFMLVLYNLRSAIPVYAYPLLIFFLVLPFLIEKASKVILIERYEREFPDFLRELSYYLEIGFPLPRALKEISKTYKGALTNEIKRMAYQMTLGYPFTKVLECFSKRVNSSYIRKAIATLREVERFGGDIKRSILSTATILQEINTLEREREVKVKAHTLTFYGIILIFVITVIVLRNIIENFVTITISNPKAFLQEFDNIILSTVIINSIFTGFVIGLALRGSAVRGILHSFLLSLLSITLYILALYVV